MVKCIHERIPLDMDYSVQRPIQSLFHNILLQTIWCNFCRDCEPGYPCAESLRDVRSGS